MMNTVWAVVRNGQIEPSEPIQLPEGARVLITLPELDDCEFWSLLSQEPLESIWNNIEDDIYAELLDA